MRASGENFHVYGIIMVCLTCACFPVLPKVASQLSNFPLSGLESPWMAAYSIASILDSVGSQ